MFSNNTAQTAQTKSEEQSSGSLTQSVMIDLIKRPYKESRQRIRLRLVRFFLKQVLTKGKSVEDLKEMTTVGITDHRITQRKRNKIQNLFATTKKEDLEARWKNFIDFLKSLESDIKCDLHCPDAGDFKKLAKGSKRAHERYESEKSILYKNTVEIDQSPSKKLKPSPQTETKKFNIDFLLNPLPQTNGNDSTTPSKPSVINRSLTNYVQSNPKDIVWLTKEEMAQSLLSLTANQPSIKPLTK